MNGEAEDSPAVFSRFRKLGRLNLKFMRAAGLSGLRRMTKRRLIAFFLVLFGAAALIDFFVLGLARRTFLFYTIDGGIATVEERMLVSGGNTPYSSTREVDITRYVEEVLLGPVSPNSLPLFPKETRLCSLLYRDGVVYADLSEEAALPYLEGSALSGAPLQGALLGSGAVFTSLETLYCGVKRNFPFVREVRFFIAGKAAYAGKFR